MSSEFDQPGDERIAELVVNSWDKELTAEERTELRRLMAFSDEITAEDFEYAAAALHVALVAPDLEEMPDHLRSAILAGAGVPAQAQGPVGPRAPAAFTRPLTAAPAGVSRGAAAVEPANLNPTLGSPPWGWITAFAAALILAAVGWLVPRPPEPVPVAQVQVAPEEPEPEPDPTPSELRKRLMAESGQDLVQVAWTATDDPYLKDADVGGDVVWSQARQEGYMRFVGLPPNDPSQAQYQLWVFDGARNDKYPVDGGVFDVAAGGEGTEVVVPIRAKLPVSQVTLFAVTLEEPGGVVVSSREHILTVAEAPKGK